MISAKKGIQWQFAVAAFVAALAVWTTREALVPFIIAFFLAYLLDPLLDWMEKKKVPRTVAVLFLISSIFLLLLAVALLLYPHLETQLTSAIKHLPAYAETIQSGLAPIIERISGYDRAEVNEMIWKAVGKMGNLPLKVLEAVYEFAASSASSAAGIVTTFFIFLIVPVATFYFMRDIDSMKEKLLSLVPEKNRDKVAEIFRDIDRTLSAFVRGQFTVASIMAVCYSVGLYFIGAPMWLFIGILAGYANIVPYLALVVGFLPAVILTYLEYRDFAHVLYVLLLFGGVQLLEGFFLTPKIMGESVGLHPIAIMAAVLIGGMFFGIVGIILAVPAAAVIKVLLDHLNRSYRASSLYTGKEEEE